jgi:hypothetical protein
MGEESKQAVKQVLAVLTKLAETLWEKFLRGVRGPNSSRYQHFVKIYPRAEQLQKVAELAAGEMAGELRHSLSLTGAYEKGIAKLTKIWGVNGEWIRRTFLEAGSLGDVVFDLPKPQTVRKSLAKQMLEMLQQKVPSTLQEALNLLQPVLMRSRIKHKSSFQDVFQKAESLPDLERGLLYLDLAFSVGKAAVVSDEESYGDEPVDNIPGGLAEGMSPEDFDADALQKGIRIELEHTYDPEIAMEISMDHLVEDPNYYEWLPVEEQRHKPKEGQCPEDCSTEPLVPIRRKPLSDKEIAVREILDDEYRGEGPLGQETPYIDTTVIRPLP